MAAVAAHEGVGEQTHLCQEPAHHGYLEDDAHGQAEHEERGDVGVQRDEVLHVARHLVGAQEAEGEREDEEVAHQHAHQEHHVAAAHHTHGIAPLVGIETGRDEEEELVEDVGRGAEDAHAHGRLHVDDELLGQTRADQLHAEGVGPLPAPRRHAVQQAVGHEVRVLGRQHQGEELLLEQEGHYAAHHAHGDHPHEHRPQHVQVVPKGQLVLLSHSGLLLFRFFPCGSPVGRRGGSSRGSSRGRL